MKKLRLILFISLLISSCQNDEITRAKLNDFSKLFTVSKDNVVEIVSNSEFSNIIEYLEHDISVYTITYNTTYQGKQIIASGMVAFPDTEQGLSLIHI